MEGQQRFLKLSTMVMITYVVVLSCHGGRAVVRAADIATKCQNSLGQVSECFSYVEGKDSAPSSGCCSIVQTLYKNQKECLCYLLQQANSNSTGLQGLNIGKVLQLAPACNLGNVNKTECIADLGLTPSSPGASIFVPSPPGSSTNSSSGSGSSSSTTTTPSPSNSGAFEQRAFYVQGLIMLVMAPFLYMFPVGL